MPLSELETRISGKGFLMRLISEKNFKFYKKTEPIRNPAIISGVFYDVVMVFILFAEISERSPLFFVLYYCLILLLKK